MESVSTLDLIRESFEVWYNKNVSCENPVSVFINYNDIQHLALKAIHTVSISLDAVGVKNDLMFTTHLIHLEENYNHGIVSAQKAKDKITKQLLEYLYSYSV